MSKTAASAQACKRAAQQEPGGGQCSSTRLAEGQLSRSREQKRHISTAVVTDAVQGSFCLLQPQLCTCVGGWECADVLVMSKYRQRHMLGSCLRSSDSCSPPVHTAAAQLFRRQERNKGHPRQHVQALLIGVV